MFVPAEIGTPDRPARILITLPTDLSWLPVTECINIILTRLLLQNFTYFKCPVSRAPLYTLQFFQRGGGATAPPPKWARASSFTNDASQSVGLLWTSNQLVAETSTLQHTTLTTNTHAHRWDSNPQSQQASGRRPTPKTSRPLGTGKHCSAV